MLLNNIKSWDLMPTYRHETHFFSKRDIWEYMGDRISWCPYTFNHTNWNFVYYFHNGLFLSQIASSQATY